MIIIIFPCQFTLRTYFWSGGDLFRVYCTSIGIVQWFGGLASFDRADHASNVIRVPLHHSMRGLDVLNEMEKRLSTNRLKMKGLFFHVDSEENE